MRKKNILYLILLGLLIGMLTSYISHSQFIDVDQNVLKNKQTEKNNVNVNELIDRAKKAYYNGDLSSSRQLYISILKNNPNHLNALQNLIHVNKELGNYEEAIKNYYRLIPFNPENLNWKYELGVTLYQRGNYEQAKEILTGINNKIEPNSDISGQYVAMLYYYLGKIAQKNEKLDQAVDYFETGIKKNSSVPLNYMGKGRVYRQQNKLEKLIQAYQNALKIDSSLVTLYPELAKTFEVLNDYKETYYYWKKCIDIGIESELARKKVKQLENKYSDLKEEEKKEKERKRARIDWVDIDPITETSDIPKIRIGLLDRITELTFRTGVSFRVVDKKEKNIILQGEAEQEWQVKYDQNKYFFYRQNRLVKQIEGDRSILIQLRERDATTVIYNISYGSGYFWAGSEDRQYRGALELLPATETDKFSVINLVNLEAYLFSVVPAEMPAWWPEEALKAQSIAARSYALKNRGRHNKDNYDLCASVHCAVYKGVNSENERTSEAVLATRGRVATYKDKIINAVFSSNSGGYSENSKDVWGTEVPYLSGANNMINTEEDFPLAPYELENWLSSQPPSYSNHPIYTGDNSYRWIKSLPASYLENKFDLSRLKNVIPHSRSQGGNIKSILLVGPDKKITVEKDNIRSALGGLRSNRFIIKKIYDSQDEIETLIIYGGGWGHNVGLDQTAAAGMATREINYKEIIHHFYSGTEIKEIY